jgi:F420-0:gamma-glutamyl ligase-like protein
VAGNVKPDIEPDVSAMETPSARFVPVQDSVIPMPELYDEVNVEIDPRGIETVVFVVMTDATGVILKEYVVPYENPLSEIISDPLAGFEK